MLGHNLLGLIFTPDQARGRGLFWGMTVAEGGIGRRDSGWACQDFFASSFNHVKLRKPLPRCHPSKPRSPSALMLAGERIRFRSGVALCGMLISLVPPRLSS